MRHKLVVRATGEELRGALAEYWREITLQAVREKGYCTVALSGGATPAEFYRHLARHRDLPWGGTHLFQADERIVPHDAPASNYRFIKESLLDALPVPPGSLHLVPVERPRPADATCDYEEEILSFFIPREEGIPAFDILLLGIGADGHTASLFPGAAALEEQERLVVFVPPTVAGVPRVSLTFTTINNARNVIFLVTGAEKREILARVLEGKDASLPASRAKPREGKLFVFADSAAAPGVGG